MRKKSTNEEKGSTNEPQKEKSRGKGADDGGKRRSGKPIKEIDLSDDEITILTDDMLDKNS